jgi:hypothetical protein
LGIVSISHIDPGGVSITLELSITAGGGSMEVSNLTPLLKFQEARV